MKKIKLSFLTIGLISLFLLPSLSLAYTALEINFEPQDPGIKGDASTTVTTNAISQYSGLGTQDPIDITVMIINWILGVLGLIFLVLVLYAGFKWMTSAGEEESITKSKKILTASVIALIIILTAYGVTNFIFGNLIEFTGADHF